MCSSIVHDGEALGLLVTKLTTNIQLSTCQLYPVCLLIFSSVSMLIKQSPIVVFIVAPLPLLSPILQSPPLGFRKHDALSNAAMFNKQERSWHLNHVQQLSEFL